MLRNFVALSLQMATEYRNKGFMVENLAPPITTGPPTWRLTWPFWIGERQRIGGTPEKERVACRLRPRLQGRRPGCSTICR